MTILETDGRSVPIDEPGGVADQGSFLRAMHPQLIGAFVYRGFSRVEAEDLTQETLARTCLHWTTVTAAASPEAWVHRTGLNLSKSWLRRLRVARRHEATMVPAPSGQADPTDRPVLEAALATLTPRQREAVVLRYFVDLSVADTALTMRCAPGTVRALTAQAIAVLRQRIDIEDQENDR